MNAHSRGRSFLALALLTAPALLADAPRKLTYTTHSEVARQEIEKAIRAIDSMQFGDPVLGPAKKAAAADPDFAFAHYLIGVATFPPEQGKPEIDKTVELLPKASEGERQYIQAAMLLNRDQKPEEALAAFRKLRDDYPGERKIQMMIGQIANAQGHLDEARAAFEKALAMDGSTPRVYTFLGNLAMLKDDYPKARGLFETALTKAPAEQAPVGTYYSIALSHLYEGGIDRSLATLDTLLKMYKQNKQDQNFPEVFIHNTIARINLENGRLEPALAAYKRGFESVPGSTLEEQEKRTWLGRLHHGTGRTLARMGKHAEAWKEADLVKQMIDEGGEAGKQYLPAWHYMAGYLKLEAGDTAAALEHLKQTDMTNDFHRLLLARAYERSGDKPAARKLYQDIVKSTDTSVERALAYPEAKRKLAS